MSLIHYLMWGYLLLFALVAFGIYAACVMAGRADQAEEELRKQTRPSQRPAISRLAANSAKPAVLEQSTAPVDSEHEPSYT